MISKIDHTTSLHLATRNAAAFWTALAQARGDELVRRPGFVGVNGSERSGLRILLLSPDPSPGDLAELMQLVWRSLGWNR